MGEYCAASASGNAVAGNARLFSIERDRWAEVRHDRGDATGFPEHGIVG
jgi:hypothetical protein